MSIDMGKRIVHWSLTSNDNHDDDSVSDEEDDDADAVLLLKGCLLHKQSVWEGVWSSSLYNIVYGVVLPCLVW